MPAGDTRPFWKKKSWWVAALAVAGQATAYAAGAVPGPWAIGLGAASVTAYGVAKLIEAARKP